jgi:hypothetical protein
MFENTWIVKEMPLYFSLAEKFNTATQELRD